MSQGEWCHSGEHFCDLTCSGKICLRSEQFSAGHHSDVLNATSILIYLLQDGVRSQWFRAKYIQLPHTSGASLKSHILTEDSHSPAVTQPSLWHTHTQWSIWNVLQNKMKKSYMEDGTWVGRLNKPTLTHCWKSKVPYSIQEFSILLLVIFIGSI